LALSAPSATIYYTLDGSDPRLAGGNLSSSAKKYEQPFSVNGTVAVKVRAISGPVTSGEWSALVEF
jgi:hypothetical protein